MNVVRATFGYWNFRGLGQPVRHLLHYKGVDFNDKRYTSFDSWQNDKLTLRLDFPNLPYYIDGEVRLTQSTAILRHLARRHGLDGRGKEELIRCTLAEQQIIDFRSSLTNICYHPDFRKLKVDLVVGVPAQLKLFATFLGERPFLAGEEVTYVDFMAYETFDFYRYLIPFLLSEFPSLLAYQNRFEGLPQLQTYFSTTYRRWPILGPVSHFGGKESARGVGSSNNPQEFPHHHECGRGSWICCYILLAILGVLSILTFASIVYIMFLPKKKE